MRRFNSDPCLHFIMMDDYEKEWNDVKNKRFQLAKKWFKYLPRRSAFQKYRFFRWFGDKLFKRKYLWSFKYEAVKPAFYAGWILTLLPCMGIQTFVATVLALIFKGNLMILIALQMISNPFTVGPLWTFEYHIGKHFLSFLDTSNQIGIQEAIGSVAQAKGLAFFKVTLGICIGGILIGYICAFISCCIYKKFCVHNITTFEEFVAQKKKK